MNQYEIAIVYDPSLEVGLDKATDRVEKIFKDNGGHGMIFHTFEGKLMMVLHAPDGRMPRPLIFEIEDTGETLRIVRPFSPE